MHGWWCNPGQAAGEGPLAEIPFGVKDIVEAKGMATEYGSPLYKGRVGNEDAAIIREPEAVRLELRYGQHTPDHFSKFLAVVFFQDVTNPLNCRCLQTIPRGQWESRSDRIGARYQFNEIANEFVDRWSLVCLCIECQEYIT